MDNFWVILLQIHIILFYESKNIKYVCFIDFLKNYQIIQQYFLIEVGRNFHDSMALKHLFLVFKIFFKKNYDYFINIYIHICNILKN